MPFPDPNHAVEGTVLPPRPGLGKKDRAILDAMIANGFVVWDRAWYNQAVGNLDRGAQAALPPNLQDWFELTYSKRPDVIYEHDGELFAAEVKPWASYVALGQALMYRHFATEKTNPTRQVKALILTDVADPDLLPVAAKLGIEVRQLTFFLEPRPTFQT